MRRLLATNPSRPPLLLAASSLLIPAVALGETEPIRIEYRAVAGCPSIEEFRSQVFARAPSARPATGAELARTFVVTIEAARGGVVGSLVVREASGATLARKVEGTRCEQVATALSLATALAIDPQAPEPEHADGPASTDQSNTSSGSSQSPDSPQTKTEAKAEPAKDEASRSNPADESNTSEPARPESAQAWWSAAAGPSAEIGIGPQLSLGASAQFERHLRSPGALVSAGGLELSWLQSGSYAVNSASSSFRFVHARPFVCSRELALPAALRLGPCLGAELGAITGAGADLPNATTETRFWAAGDARLRLRFEPREQWFVELAAALVLPLTRYSFVFREPETQIYEVPWLGSAAGVRLGTRL